MIGPLSEVKCFVFGALVAQWLQCLHKVFWFYVTNNMIRKVTRVQWQYHVYTYLFMGFTFFSNAYICTCIFYLLCNNIVNLR